MENRRRFDVDDSALDSSLGLLFLGVGNPSPQMDGLTRPGDNLYTVSLVALDVETGKLRWHYQQVPHDLWGYDVASPPVLFDTAVDGKKVSAVGQASKTGWFYVNDRRTGALLYKSEPFCPRKISSRHRQKKGCVSPPALAVARRGHRSRTMGVLGWCTLLPYTCQRSTQ